MQQENPFLTEYPCTFRETPPQPMRSPIPFCSFGGYVFGSSYWWKDVYRYIVRGWWYDIYTYWHRARYGWSPKDTWNLDGHLNRVLAGALAHLAEHTHSYPVGYHRGATRDDCTDINDGSFAEWQHDLRRWARAFSDLEWYNDEGDVELFRAGVPAAVRIDVERWFQQRAERALVEMTPWWGALWD